MSSFFYLFRCANMYMGRVRLCRRIEHDSFSNSLAEPVASICVRMHVLAASDGKKLIHWIIENAKNDEEK